MYSTDDLVNAVHEVQNNSVGLAEAAKAYGIPKSTLHMKVKANAQLNARKGPPPVFSPEEESSINEWALDKISKENFLRQNDILNHVQESLIKEGRENPFTNSRPGRSWLRSFFKRHPKLLKKIRSVSKHAGSRKRGSRDTITEDDSDSDSERPLFKPRAKTLPFVKAKSSGDESADEMDTTEDSNSNLEQAKPENTASGETQKMIEEIFNENDDVDNFAGYHDEKPTVIDWEKLNVKPSELDEIEIKTLKDKWWESEDMEVELPDLATMKAAVPASPSATQPVTHSTSPSGGRLRSASSNPAFKKPFVYGFVREVVYRGSVGSGPNSRRLADIYYYNPEGRKMRSVREIAEYLAERVDDIKLTVGNFTFLKEPVGVNDDTKEVIRDAKSKKYTPIPKKLPLPPLLRPKPTVVKLPRAKSKVTPVQAVQPRVGEVEIRVTKPTPILPKPTVPPTKPSVDGGVAKSTLPPCSIHCPKAIGTIPSLQCCVCVCLYHPACVGLSASTSDSIHRYVCANCKLETGQTPNSDSPELPLQTSELPPLTRLPRSGDSSITVTGNWSPSITPLQAVPTPQSRPLLEQQVPQQSLALMNGKKYVVIPRQNMVPSGTSPVEEGNAMTPMALVGQPQLQMLTPAATPQIGATQTILPKGSILVNQPSGPGTPGGIFLMTPAEPQDAPAHPLPQLMLLNTSGSAGPLPLVATTPTNLNFIPRLPGEGASEKTAVSPKSRALLQGGWTFTERLSVHHQALLQVMKFLTVQEVLRASNVCRSWRLVAADPVLWVSAKMKNSRVMDWTRCVAALEKHGTIHLDLRRTLLPKREEEAQAAWQQFCSVLNDSRCARNLTRIDLCRCPGNVVASIAECCPNLQLLGATAITAKGDYLDLKPISLLSHLQGLRLKSFHGMTMENFHGLENLKNLRQLSLTTIRALPATEVATTLKSMKSLELLELGDCTGLLAKVDVIASAMQGLKKLKRLRLEKLVKAEDNKDSGAVCTLLKALGKLPLLSHLELVNIEASDGCDQAISAMSSLKDFLIIPSYMSHGAKTCQVLLRGILKLTRLSSLTWVVTNEVTGVTKKLIRAKHNREHSNIDESEDCILILPPYSSSTEASTSKADKKSKLDQLDILALSKLQEILTVGLPLTHVVINKITFQGTWRQSLSEWDLTYNLDK